MKAAGTEKDSAAGLVTSPLNVSASHCYSVTVNVNLSTESMTQDYLKQLIVQVIQEQLGIQEPKRKKHKKKI